MASSPLSSYVAGIVATFGHLQGVYLFYLSGKPFHKVSTLRSREGGKPLVEPSESRRRKWVKLLKQGILASVLNFFQLIGV